ncbi:MAG: tetratricopeptide repeat-containing sensor histidine kinase [Dysgonamonadaceae bacterium]|nr:tetratricopeptide repeat-containing sensor histidine kinase [Dysgonamonadaceae bacterium]
MMTGRIEQICIVSLCLIFAGIGAKAQEFTNHRGQNADSLETLLKSGTLDKTALPEIYSKLSWSYQESNPDKMAEIAQQGIPVALETKQWDRLAELYRNLGVACYNRSQYEQAFENYEKALGYTPLIPDENLRMRIESNILCNTGNVHYILNHHHQAINYYLKALALFEKLGVKQNVALTLGNIGGLFMNMENYEQAEIYLKKYHEISREVGDSLYIYDAIANLAYVELQRENYGEALVLALEALDFYDKNSEEVAERIDLISIAAEIYLEGFKNTAKAKEYASTALREAEEHNMPRSVSQACVLLSAAAIEEKNYHLAEQYAEQAFKTDSTELHCFEYLAKSKMLLGKGAEAINFFDRYMKYKDEYSTKNYQTAFSEMNVVYETGKKQLEIERQQRVIERRNTERIMFIAGLVLTVVILVLVWRMLRYRTKRNRILKEMNATKDKFFSIISHDLKNPAVAQRDALQTLVKFSEKWDSKTLSDFYSELLKSADSQVELLYNLLGWAQLQTGRMTYTPEPFDIVPRLRSEAVLITKMAEQKGVALKTDLPEEAIVTGDKNMLATVVRNLLTNAVKFTPAGGEVVLSASIGERATAITIADSGVGMTTEQVRDLFRLDNHSSRQGTAGESGTGLGLVVCKELLEKHGSALHVESEPGKGSRFWFEI